MNEAPRPGSSRRRRSLGRGRPSIAVASILLAACLILALSLTSVFGLGRANRGGTGPGGSGVGLASASARDGARPSAGSKSSGTPVAGGQSPVGSHGVASPGVGSPGVASPAGSSRTDPVLVGAGDIATCGGSADEATANLLDGIEGTIFTAGDNAYEDGTEEEFRDCYGPNWGRQLARTRPAAGNHDWQSSDLGGYLGYFGQAVTTDGGSWYAYDLGTWHIIVLDSNCEQVLGCDADSSQGRWLAADLATSTARCTMAIWHHPRWSSGVHGDSQAVAPFWTMLYDAGADVIVNGHDHDYERFAPQDPDGRANATRGIREFVVGTGGIDLRGFPGNAANSEVRSASDHGVIRFGLHDGSYSWTFIAAGTDFSDSGTGNCH
ncbi:MAG: metallophosphoesterase [Chloroflexi bacterium]|nr:metallophosphoesterase [Chloroflexota bacterium]